MGRPSGSRRAAEWIKMTTGRVDRDDHGRGKQRGIDGRDKDEDNISGQNGNRRDGGRGELAAAVTGRGSVGAGTLKPAMIPC
jgi:hypothetical protein